MKKYLSAAVAAVLAISLTACGGPSDGGDGGGTLAPSAAGWDINPKAYSEVKDGGEFIGYYGSEWASFNLNSASGNDSEKRWALSPMVGNWIMISGDGTKTPNPDFIANVKDEEVNGKTVITLDQNPKAVWNDGTKISLNDWQTTWKVLGDCDSDYELASCDGFDAVESVEQGENENQIVITFKTPYPDWTSVIATGPARADSIETAEIFNTGWTEPKNEWFSGPFIMESFDKASQTLVQVPNPNWWGQKPKLEKLTWKMVTTSQVPTAFANGEITFINIGPDVASYTQAAGKAGTAIRVANGPNFRHFTFNSTAGFLTDIKVRQAIVMGLDRQLIAESDLAGLPLKEFKPMNNNLYTTSLADYQDLGKETGIDYNPEGAKKLLEEAGWTMGANNYYEKDGQELVVKFSQLTGVKASENEALQAQSQLKEIGIKLEIISLNPDSSEDWPGAMTSGRFEIIAFSWIGTAWPLHNIGQIYGTGSDSNYARLSNPAVDELKAKIDQETDEAERTKLGQQAAKEIWTSVHTLPLYQRPDIIGCPENLANFGAVGMAQYPQDWTIIGYTS